MLPSFKVTDGFFNNPAFVVTEVAVICNKYPIFTVFFVVSLFSLHTFRAFMQKIYIFAT